MTDVLGEVRAGARALWRAPGSAATVVAILVLAISSTTAIFGVVDRVLLRPLAYPHAEELAFLHVRSPEVEREAISYPDLIDWQRENPSFSHLGAARYENFTLLGKGAPERLSGALASAELFSALGIQAQLGRLLL